MALKSKSSVYGFRGRNYSIEAAIKMNQDSACSSCHGMATAAPTK